MCSVGLCLSVLIAAGLPAGAVVYHTGNVCRKGGRGFSSDGLPRPRNSEIWPEPMGHNVFVWRLDGAEPDGDLDLRGNDFEKPEFGENVYFHGVADAARVQIRMEVKR